MGWFNKKADPISERARRLNQEIAELESQIKELDSQLQPRPGSLGASGPSAPDSAPAAAAPSWDLVLEEMEGARGGSRAGENTRGHYNELSVRKYDLPALLRRIRNHFRGPAATNPKLVNYLAAGGIQGLRPLRYERRVARNRFIALVTVLFLILLGLLVVFFHHR